eukprot:1317719-Pleurochrysis_carterae.AAC.1
MTRHRFKMRGISWSSHTSLLHVANQSPTQLHLRGRREGGGPEDRGGVRGPAAADRNCRCAERPAPTAPTAELERTQHNPF